MSPEMQATLIGALTAARPLVAAHLRSSLMGCCLLGPDGEPRRDTIEDDDREWIEQHEALLAQIDAAVSAVRGTVQ